MRVFSGGDILAPAAIARVPVWCLPRALPEAPARLSATAQGLSESLQIPGNVKASAAVAQ